MMQMKSPSSTSCAQWFFRTTGCPQPEPIWIPNYARFGSQIVIYIALSPTLAAICLIIWRVSIQRFWNRRSVWLCDFGRPDPIHKLDSAADKPPRWTALLISLLSSTVASAGLSVALSIWGGPLLLAPLVPNVLSTSMVVAFQQHHASLSLIILQGSLLLMQLVLLSTILQTTSTAATAAWFLESILSLICLALLLLMPASATTHVLDKRSNASTSDFRSPEDGFSAWDWMSVRWMTSVVRLGCARQMQEDDIWDLPLEFEHATLHLRFRELQGSVISRVMRANALDLFITTFLGILETIASLAPILFLKQLLVALEGETPDRQVAVIYGCFILASRLVGAQSGTFSLWYSRRAYERSRGEMITMIYEKTLMRKAFTMPAQPHRNKKTKGKFQPTTDAQPSPASTGKILNLMRNDVYEVSQRLWEWPQLFTRPLVLILCTVLVWQILGPAALGGVLLIVLAQFINAGLIRLRLRWEEVRRHVTDSKLQIISQFVESVRHLRWYDWHHKWLDQILQERQKELKYRVIVSLWAKLSQSINRLAASFFPVAAFYAYTMISHKPLTVDVAFPALNIIAMFNTNLNELPNLITTILNAWVAMARIENFMAEPNKECADTLTEVQVHQDDLMIKMRDASFSWPGSVKTVLTNLNLEISPGLTAICGKVGAGKTALLQAILGELDQVGGESAVPREIIGYCSQSPWLQSMSIRENILFSTPFDAVRYKEVLAACCLESDLAAFRAGDLSLLGENGVGLSGGQKARIALARAIYSRARILLLDDPIAALDHQTAETVIHSLFRSTTLTQGRIVVFVTHRMDLITMYADQVIEVWPDGSTTCIPSSKMQESDRTPEPHLEASMKIRNIAEDIAHDSDDPEVVPMTVIEEEQRAQGGVKASVYWRYIKAGNLWLWSLVVLLFCIFRVSRLAHFYFLKVWGEAYQSSGSMLLLLVDEGMPRQISLTVPDLSIWPDFGNDLPPPEEDARPWLFYFFIIALFQYVSIVSAELSMIAITYVSGKRLFEDVMRKVSRAQFRFYDVTPVGRLMNRLTSDVGVIDGQIVTLIRQVAWNVLVWLGALFVIASTTPVFLVIALLMTALFVRIFFRFLPASQSLRRLEMVSLSPLMSNFGTLLEGLTTVRAFRAEPHFQDQIIKTTDTFQRMDHFYWSLQAWLTIRFDVLSAISTFALTLAAIMTGLGAGTVGFTLSAAAEFVSCTHSICKRYGELQMQFVSVERVIELMDLEEEAEGALTPPAAWPSYTDDIVFDNVTIRYAPHLEPSLKNISFVIPAGSTVAVTGRTGSGKSTLALSLLGTILPDWEENLESACSASSKGSISIGKIDIAAVNKHALRHRITFVAQDPVLFPGSLRKNLDPLEEYTDDECESVLRRVLGAGSIELAESDTSDNIFAQNGDERQQIAESSDISADGSPAIHSNIQAHRDEDRSSNLSSTAVATTRHASPSERLPATQDAGSSDLGFGFTLSTRVDAGGKNMSQGQRQLVGLGRAVLRRSPVVILDEATASIDQRTAAVIRQVLREELRESTVITIAHRLEAVMDADYAIVLDGGRVIRAGPVERRV